VLHLSSWWLAYISLVSTHLETRLTLQIRFFVSVYWKSKDLVRPMPFSAGSFQISAG
jgi:hypothetical protein